MMTFIKVSQYLTIYWKIIALCSLKCKTPMKEKTQANFKQSIYSVANVCSCYSLLLRFQIQCSLIMVLLFQEYNFYSQHLIVFYHLENKILLTPIPNSLWFGICDWYVEHSWRTTVGAHWTVPIASFLQNVLALSTVLFSHVTVNVALKSG